MAIPKNAKRPAAPASPGRVSMRDVAALAGVSRSAVSLALQGHPSIPLSTRESIIAASRQLGYRKNLLVAALMSVRRNHTAGPKRATVAFLTSHPPDDSWRKIGPHRQVHAAASAHASEVGLQLEEFSLGDLDMRPERVRSLLKARGVHGLLVAPLPGDYTRLDFDISDFATVGLGLSVKEPSIDRVAIDHFFEAQLAFQNCLALGYRRIGFAVAAGVSHRLEHRWRSGILLAQQHLPVAARVPPLMPQSQEEIPNLLDRWISRHRIEAVIYSIRAHEMMSVAPAQTGLVSLSLHNADGKIAGIKQNERAVGEGAVNLLVEKLHNWKIGVTESPQIHLVQGKWCGGLSAPGVGQIRRALL